MKTIKSKATVKVVTSIFFIFSLNTFANISDVFLGNGKFACNSAKEYCYLPNKLDLNLIKEDFLKKSDRRLKTISEAYTIHTTVVSRIKYKADQYYNQVGDNTFSTALNDFVNLLEDNFTKSGLNLTYGQDISENSRYIEKINELEEYLDQLHSNHFGNKKLIREKYSNFINDTEFQSVLRRTQQAIDDLYYNSEAGKFTFRRPKIFKMHEEVKFNFSSYFNKIGCDNLEGDLPINFLPLKPLASHSWSIPQFYSIHNLLHGKKGKPMTIVCKKVSRIFGSLKPKYDNESHTLTIPYQKAKADKVKSSNTTEVIDELSKHFVFYYTQWDDE